MAMILNGYKSFRKEYTEDTMGGVWVGLVRCRGGFLGYIGSGT